MGVLAFGGLWVLGEVAEECQCRLSKEGWAEAAPRGWQPARKQGLTFLKWVVSKLYGCTEEEILIRFTSPAVSTVGDDLLMS